MTDKQRNMAIGAIIHLMTIVDLPEEIIDSLNSVVKFLALMDDEKQKKGKWELHTDERFDIDYYKCSECGYEPYRKMDISNFCPNCGADMRPQDKEPEFNPCCGCEDYDGEGGCKSKGGCADMRE